MREEVENLSESDKKLCRMLAELGKVEAPKDFEFRVKARIAKANPRAYQKRRAWRFGYVLPATGFAAMLAFAGIYGGLSGGNQPGATNEARTVPQVEQIIQPAPSPSSEVASSDSNTNTAPPSPATPKVLKPPIQNAPFLAERKSETAPSSKRNLDENTVRPGEAGSKADTSRESDTKYPRGFNPENKKLTPNSEVKEQDFSAQDMFKTLGVETVIEKGVLKVKTLPSGNSGLKYGDEIESINDQKITNGKIKGKKVDMKKVTVKRNGETVEINLQAKPQQ